MSRSIALIPARFGSKRVKNKNIRLLGAHPLIACTISAALESKIFDDVVVSTDSPFVAEISQHYGATVPFLRPEEISQDLSPDIEWVEFTLMKLAESGKKYDYFSILRPTSPFRLPSTILRAWNLMKANPTADSLRAVEKCKQHPGKMWVINGTFMEPLLKEGPTQVPWHSTPYQALPLVYTQNASLEMARVTVALEHHSIAGKLILPFLTEGQEGSDINDEKDFWYVEHLLKTQQAQLPAVSRQPFISKKLP